MRILAMHVPRGKLEAARGMVTFPGACSWSQQSVMDLGFCRGFMRSSFLQ